MIERVTQWVPTMIAAGLLAIGSINGSAQEATPTATGHDHPAHIHLGTCSNLDPNPTFMLADVIAPAGADATTDDTAAIPVEQSVTTVDAALPDLRSGGYAINIHQSVEDIGTYIACGSLTSASNGDTLVVGLGERNNSGYSRHRHPHRQGRSDRRNVYLTAAAPSGETRRPHRPTRRLPPMRRRSISRIWRSRR